MSAAAASAAAARAGVAAAAASSRLAPSASAAATAAASLRVRAAPGAVTSASAAAAAAASVRHGANLKEIRGRIASVNNMVKITGTMKMIASARLNPQQRRLNEVRPLVASADRAVKDAEFDAGKKTAVVVISTDRGLCGGVNTMAARSAKDTGNAIKAAGGEVAYCLVGDKGSGIMGRDPATKDEIAFTTEEVHKVPPTFSGACIIADNVMATNPDSVAVVYNRFVNAAAYETETKKTSGAEALLSQEEIFNDYEFEEDEQANHMQDFSEFLLAINIWGGITENATTELAQRMSAMDNANRNASDMLNALNVSYNRQRQAAITTELTEIISGAAALE